MENKNTQNNELLHWIYEKSHDMNIFYNNAYLTFQGFIITIIAALLGFNERLICIDKVLLFSSIVCIITGTYLYFLHTRRYMEIVQNTYNIVAKHTDNNTHPEEDLKENNTLSKFYIFIGKLSQILQDLGLIIFLIALFKITF